MVSVITTLSVEQRRALLIIATSERTSIHKLTVDALIRKGLIAERIGKAGWDVPQTTMHELVQWIDAHPNNDMMTATRKQ